MEEALDIQGLSDEQLDKVIIRRRELMRAQHQRGDWQMAESIRYRHHRAVSEKTRRRTVKEK